MVDVFFRPCGNGEQIGAFMHQNELYNVIQHGNGVRLQTKYNTYTLCPNFRNMKCEILKGWYHIIITD